MNLRALTVRSGWLRGVDLKSLSSEIAFDGITQ